MNEFWEKAVVQPLQDLGQQAVASLSSLLGMLLLLLLGLVIGALARRSSSGFFNWSDLIGFATDWVSPSKLNVCGWRGQVRTWRGNSCKASSS